MFDRHNLLVLDSADSLTPFMGAGIFLTTVMLYLSFLFGPHR